MLSKIISPVVLNNYVDFWLQEDIPNFDLSSLASDDEEETEARIDLKEDGVLAGFPFCEAVAKKFNCVIDWQYIEGEFVKSKAVVAIVKGKVHEILMSERTILNILCRASGVATVAHKINSLIDPKWQGEIVGTRKTTPGFRIVEKYAMYVGGIGTHRYDLSSMVMLKDNHIKASGGSVENSIQNVRAISGNKFMKIEVEVSSLSDAIAAAKNGADIIMLDNMKPYEIRNVAKQIKSINASTFVEVSGGITESNIKNYAIENVDIVSSSMFCQGYKCIDLSMNFFSDAEKVKSNGLDLLSASKSTGSKQESTSKPEISTPVVNGNSSTNKSTIILSNTAKNVFTKPRPDLKRKVEESQQLKKETDEPEAKLDRTSNIESSVSPASKPVEKNPNKTNIFISPSKTTASSSTTITNVTEKISTPSSPTSAKVLSPPSNITQKTVGNNINSGYRGKRGGINRQQRKQVSQITNTPNSNQNQPSPNVMQQKLNTSEAFPQPKQVQVGMPVRLATPIVQRNNNNNYNNRNNARGTNSNYQGTSQNHYGAHHPSSNMNQMRYGVSGSPAAVLMRPNTDKYFCRRCRFQNEFGGPPNCAKCQFSLLR